MGHQRGPHFDKGTLPGRRESPRVSPLRSPHRDRPRSAVSHTETEAASEALSEIKSASLQLQSKAGRGAITPVEQQRRGVLQRRLDNYWSRRLERAERLGHHLTAAQAQSPAREGAEPSEPAQAHRATGRSGLADPSPTPQGESSRPQPTLRGPSAEGPPLIEAPLAARSLPLAKPAVSGRPQGGRGPIRRRAALPAQLQSGADGKSSSAGPALLEIVAQLEALALEAESVGGTEGAAEAEKLKAKLVELEKIAKGSDEALKQETLAGLQEEVKGSLLSAGQTSPETVGNGQAPATVQRLTGLEVGLIAAGAVVGLGLLVGGIWLLVKNRRAARPQAQLTLAGRAHENGRSFASVQASAHLTSRTQRVRYYIRWEANVVPGGHHLGQQANQASVGWVVDRYTDGRPIGSRENGLGGFFRNPDFSGPDDERGLHFFYPDGIQQRELNDGSWWFKLEVSTADGNVLSSSEVEVDWRH